MLKGQQVMHNAPKKKVEPIRFNEECSNIKEQTKKEESYDMYKEVEDLYKRVKHIDNPVFKDSLVDKPTHYNKEGDIQTIDKIVKVRGLEAAIYFCICNSDKYRDRAGLKVYDGLTLEESIVRDIKKALKYESMIKELKEKYGN